MGQRDRQDKAPLADRRMIMLRPCLDFTFLWMFAITIRVDHMDYSTWKEFGGWVSKHEAVRDPGKLDDFHTGWWAQSFIEIACP